MTFAWNRLIRPLPGFAPQRPLPGFAPQRCEGPPRPAGVPSRAESRRHSDRADVGQMDGLTDKRMHESTGRQGGDG